MSRKFPVLNSREIIAIIKKQGFVFDRQSGSHAVYIHPDGRRTTIPIHSKHDIGKGLLRQIMRDTDLREDDFRK